MSNIYLRRKRWWYAKMKDGKRIWVNLQTSDEIEARKRVLQIKDNPLLKTKGTLIDDINAFLEWKVSMNKYGRASAKTKPYTLKLFVEWLPATATISNITAKQVEDYYQYLRKRPSRLVNGRGITESTIHGYMMTLRAFFRWVINQKRARLDNPVQTVEFAICDHKARTDWINKDGATKLIDEAPDDDMRYICYSGFDAGLRKNEIVEARADWFDLENGILRIRKSEGDRLRPDELPFRPKTREERAIPLTTRFRKFMRGYLKGKQPLDFVLKPEVGHGESKYRYDFHRPFTDYMRSMKMPHITPNVMRHSFGSNLGNSRKFSALGISRLMGNSEKVADTVYIKIDPNDRRGIHVLE